MSAQSAGDSGPRRLDIADRVELAFVGVLVMLGVIAFVAFAVVMSVNTRYNFQTLRADLARVHFPSGYRLVTVRRSGTDCAHAQCSLTETWTWSGNGGRDRLGRLLRRLPRDDRCLLGGRRGQLADGCWCCV